MIDCINEKNTRIFLPSSDAISGKDEETDGLIMEGTEEEEKGSSLF
jgi:hypothetical protein